MKDIFKLLIILGVFQYLLYVTEERVIQVEAKDKINMPVSLEVSRETPIERDMKTNADRVYNYLQGKGLKHEQICAIMGNIAQESNFDTGLEEYGNKIGFGLIQWSFARRQALFDYCNDPYDIYQQLDFLLLELDTQWTGSYRHIFANSTNVEELTEAFCWGFERPSVKYANLNHRIEMAKEYSNLYR